MNVDRLRDLLEAAVKLELATIPPYLCALYSTHPGTNLEATMVIRSSWSRRCCTWSWPERAERDRRPSPGEWP